MCADSAIVSGVRSLWKHGHLQDLNIIVQDHSFHVHKVIMSAVSDFFHAMFTGNMAEKEQDCVKLGVLSAAAMAHIISFIYEDKMDLTRSNSIEILDAAFYLQIPSAVEACVQFIVDTLDVSNCYRVLSVFQNYSLHEGVEGVQLFMKAHSCSISKEVDPGLLSYQEFTFLVYNWQGPEMDLFLLVVKWVKADHRKRKVHLAHLLCHVRFCLLTPEELSSIKEMKLYRKARSAWRHLLDDAVKYHSLPINIKVITDSEQSSIRSALTPACFAGDTNEAQSHMLNREKQWSIHKLPVPKDCDIAYATIEVNNFLIVNPPDTGQVHEWHVFDPRTLRWSQLACLEQPRALFALVYIKERLHLLGGQVVLDNIVHSTDSVETYNFSTDTWTCDIRMPAPLLYHGACVLQDCIYVSGGRFTTDEDEDDLAEMQCFNLTSRQWENKAAMLEPRIEHMMSVMKLHGEEFICILDSKLQPEYYNTRSDQWSKCTFSFSQKLPSHVSEGHLMRKGNTVYFFDDHGDGVWNNDGVCMELVYPEKGSEVSLRYIPHFCPRLYDCWGSNLDVYGAILSVPLHKLPPPVHGHILL